MTQPIAHRLQQALGSTPVGTDPDGRPRVAPDSANGIATVLGLASAQGWSVRLEGRGSWQHNDSPADLVLSTAALDGAPRVAAADLVATVPCGLPLVELNRRLADHGMWLPWDPPGTGDRSVGGVIATGTAGALRLGFGGIRDSLLGITVVLGDGRIVRPGGTVVKNVAGYDLTRLQAGGFGAFGVLTEVHVRLRAHPGGDATHVAHGDRDSLTRAGRDLVEGGFEPTALELLSPALGAHADWTLAARLIAPEPALPAQAALLHALTTLSWIELTREQAGAFWSQAARGAMGGPITLRLGVLTDGLDQTIDLLEERLDLGLLSAGAATGALRWTGRATAETLLTLRRVTAEREIPLTIERAPATLLRAVGHFGAYHEGVGRLVHGLRRSFDPKGVLLVPTEQEPAG